MFNTILIIYVIRYLVHCNSNDENKKKIHYAKYLRLFFATLLGLTISSVVLIIIPATLFVGVVFTDFP